MRIVLTNDDGIHAPGLLVLARALCEAGHDLVIVAPIDEASGSSAATGPWRGATSRIVPYEAVQLDLPRVVPSYGLAAQPALCVSIALAETFGTPIDCVVAGINRGRNVGRSVLHSGTIGAAFTAAIHGTPAVAFSVEAHQQDPHYETVTRIGLPLIDLACALPPGNCVNLNVPDVSFDQLRGVRRAHVGTNPIVFHANTDGEGIHLLRGLRHATTFDPNSDEGLTSQGYATVTIVRPPHESDHPAIEGPLSIALQQMGDYLAVSRT